jgi:hypothetical protein
MSSSGRPVLPPERIERMRKSRAGRRPSRADQPHGFVDGDVRLALRVRVDRLDLVAFDPAVLIPRHTIGSAFTL